MTSKHLPTEDQINLHNSLDEIRAVRHFFGKTLEDAEKMFVENSDKYYTDLFWMGPRAFNFYLDAVDRYLLSESSNDDSSIVYGLLGVFESRWTFDKDAIDTARIVGIIDHVLERFDKFGVNPTVHGNLREKYLALKKRVIDLSADSRSA